jgi:threonyl-tRNA synthetase
MVKDMYKTLGFELSVELSFRDDSDKYFGDPKVWANAEEIIEKVAKEEGLSYKVEKGEAAFYGPKIDIHVKDALNRSWQCATVQLDFVQPERFDLTYIDQEGNKQRPAIVHKAILGSIERFLSVYIEHTAGKFPVWIAPEQIRVITLNQSDEIVRYAEDFIEKVRNLGLRVNIDNDNESVGKKIRQAEMLKIPYVVVIGNKEVANNQVIPRIRGDLIKEQLSNPIDIDRFLESVKDEYFKRLDSSILG